MITNDRQIEIYNFEGMVVLPIPSNPDGLLIEAGTEDNPVIDIISFGDLKLINAKTDIFKIGRLRFREDEADEIYEALHIKDRENIMSEKDIRKFLLNDSNENLKRVKGMKSLALITRIKKILFQMGMSKQYNISNKLVAIINERYEELKFDPTGSSDIDLSVYIPEEKHDQNKDFENMIKTMQQEMMKQFKKEIDEVKRENEKLKSQLKTKETSSNDKKEKKTDSKTKSSK